MVSEIRVLTTMKEELSSTRDHQTNTVYLAVPIGDQEEEMKIPITDHGASQGRKMNLATLLLLLGMSLFCVHKVMFDHHVSNVFHFAKHGPPCHHTMPLHHVRFNPIPNDEHHHAMVPPPEMHLPPYHGGFDHHHDEDQHHTNPHDMGHLEMHHSNDHYNAENYDGMLPKALSKWEVWDQKDSSDDKDVPSIDSSESGDESSELDLWERIADIWSGSQDHSKDSSDSSDVSVLDVRERIGDIWSGSNDQSKDSSDSSDVSKDNRSELDVWERMADYWVASKDLSKDSSDSYDSEDEDS